MSKEKEGFAVEKPGANHRALLRAQTRSLGFAVACCALLVTAAWSSAAAAIPTSEREVLVNFYNQTTGWGTNAWNGPVGTECTWAGVTCDAQGAHVVGINVSGPNIPGGGVETIAVADQGTLHGLLPDLSGLSELKYFSVRNNHFTGSIPSLSELSKLEEFDVSYNDLTGSIPSLEGLGSLYFFAVYRNQLNGGIPNFSGAPKMGEFRAGYNHLTGPIPDLSGLTGLDTFEVRYNQLNGSIPSLEQVKYLYSFDASHNRLSGSIPTLPPRPESPYGIRSFDVSFNLLSGDLPSISAKSYPYARFKLCPNLLNRAESQDWDELVPKTPWYGDCLDAKVNLNQFGLTGTWYNPTTSGQGFLLQGFPDLYGAGQGLLFGSWFTFGQDYGQYTQFQQSWYSLQGNVDDRLPYVQLDMYTGEGGNFAAPPRVAATKVGTVLFAMSDCSHATLKYTFNGSLPKNVRYIPLTRLSGNTQCAPAGDNGAAPSNFLLSGSWYDPQMSGQGLLFDINPDQKLLFAAWYTYAKDGSGSQRWFTMQSSDFAPGMRVITGVEILTATDGLIDDPRPVNKQSHLGTADIAFQDCSNMTLTYRFTAGENAGASGTLKLVRLGPPPAGCGP